MLLSPKAKVGTAQSMADKFALAVDAAFDNAEHGLVSDQRSMFAVNHAFSRLSASPMLPDVDRLWPSPRYCASWTGTPSRASLVNNYRARGTPSSAVERKAAHLLSGLQIGAQAPDASLAPKASWRNALVARVRNQRSERAPKCSPGREGWDRGRIDIRAPENSHSFFTNILVSFSPNANFGREQILRMRMLLTAVRAIGGATVPLIGPFLGSRFHGPDLSCQHKPVSVCFDDGRDFIVNQPSPIANRVGCVCYQP